MKEQNQAEQPDPQKCKKKTAQDQVEIAKGQAQVDPSLVGRVSLDEPGTINLEATLDPGSFEKDEYPALQPGEIAIFRTTAKAMMG
jgi:hypothetical protein